MSDFPWWQIILSIVGGGIGVAIVNGIWMRRKVGAEAESVTVGTAAVLLQGMRDDVTRLLDRAQAAENAAVEARVRAAAAERRAEHAERAVRRTRQQISAIREASQLCARRVQVLEAEMQAAGLAPPPWPADTGTPGVPTPPLPPARPPRTHRDGNRVRRSASNDHQGGGEVAPEGGKE